MAAEDSLELSRIEARRQVERTDVEWEREKHKFPRVGVVTHRNVGTTTAHMVTAVLTINGQRFDLPLFGDVEPDGLIEHDASELYNQSAQQHAANVRNASSAGVILAGSPRFRVTARISWQSELGTPSIATL